MIKLQKMKGRMKNMRIIVKPNKSTVRPTNCGQHKTQVN